MISSSLDASPNATMLSYNSIDIENNKIQIYINDWVREQYGVDFSEIFGKTKFNFKRAGNGAVTASNKFTLTDDWCECIFSIKSYGDCSISCFLFNDDIVKIVMYYYDYDECLIEGSVEVNLLDYNSRSFSNLIQKYFMFIHLKYDDYYLIESNLGHNLKSWLNSLKYYTFYDILVEESNKARL